MQIWHQLYQKRSNYHRREIIKLTFRALTISQSDLTKFTQEISSVIALLSSNFVAALLWCLSLLLLQIMKKLLMKCFDKASELGACSIGLPLIGTGTLQFPYAVAVEIMVEAAVEHSQGNPESSLEEFRFIVFNDDQKGIASFEDKFTEFKEKQQPTELEAIRKETNASGSCKENEVETVTQYHCDELGDSTHELITCSLPQNVIIHGRKESLDEAMSALEDETKKACNEPSEVKHDVLGRLSKRCLKRLKRKSHSLDVKLEQPESRCIRLQGLPKDVMNVSMEVNSIITEQLKREYDEDKAEQMFRTVRWNMISTSGNEKPFDKIANLEIESAYKAKQPSVLFTHQNQKAEINFDTNEVTFLKNGRKKRVRRKDGKNRRESLLIKLV